MPPTIKVFISILKLSFQADILKIVLKKHFTLTKEQESHEHDRSGKEECPGTF